jgi:hypothetical protein
MFWRRWLWRIASSGMLRRAALVQTDVSEELSASFIKMTRISELGTRLAVTSNWRTLRINKKWLVRDVQPLRSFPAFHVTQNFIPSFTRIQILPIMSQTNSVHRNPSYLSKIHLNIIHSPWPCFSSGIYPYYFPTNNQYLYLHLWVGIRIPLGWRTSPFSKFTDRL